MKNISVIVYVIGIMLFALFYSTIKTILDSELVFIGAVFLYLIMLRLLGYFLARKFNDQETT
jgi:purine-cytosine permease-like protein